MNPETLTVQSLLNCLVREVSWPEEQVRECDGHLIVRLPRSGRLLRLGTRRRSAGPGPRLTGEAAIRHGDAWQPAGWAELTPLIAEELTLATGMRNEEFAAQVRASHASITEILRARTDDGGGRDPGQDQGMALGPRVARYLSSASSASTCGSPTASGRTPGTSWPRRSR